MTFTTARIAVGKLRPEGQMWPDELFHPAQPSQSFLLWFEKIQFLASHRAVLVG